MPEDAEVPTEHVQEAVEHELHAQHAAGGSEGTAWTSLAALSAAILAVFAALSALYAGHDANEAMIEQIRASDGYAFYQAKGIKSSVLQAKADILEGMGKTVDPQTHAAIERYRTEQEEIRKEADADSAASRAHMERHGVLARSVTFFQIAIAIAATSVLTKKRPLWFVSLLLGGLGIVFLAMALASSGA